MGAGYMFQTSAELEIVKDIKEKITYVAENVAEEEQKRNGNSQQTENRLFCPFYNIYGLYDIGYILYAI